MIGCMVEEQYNFFPQFIPIIHISMEERYVDLKADRFYSSPPFSNPHPPTSKIDNPCLKHFFLWLWSILKFRLATCC